MRRIQLTVLTLAALSLASGLVMTPLASAHNTARQCTFNGDCAEPLVCAGGYCRVQCMTDRDCTGDWVCRNATPGRPVSPALPQSAAGIPRDRQGRSLPPPTVNLGDGPPVEMVGDLRWNICMPPGGSVTIPVTAVPAAAVPAAAHANPGYAVPQGRSDQATASRTNGARFWVDGEGALWFEESGSAPERLGGVLKSEPSSVVMGDRVEAFFLGSDAAVWSIARVGGKWTGMYSLGGVLTSAPVAVAAGKGDDVIVRATGSDGTPFEIRREGGTWGGWQPAK